MTQKEASAEKVVVTRGKKNRDFRERDEWQQDELVSSMWCDTCNEGNLRIQNLQEYEVKGVVYLEGTCPECGDPVVTAINGAS